MVTYDITNTRVLIQELYFCYQDAIAIQISTANTENQMATPGFQNECVDQLSHKKCQRIKKKNRCSKKNAQKNCRKACHLCQLKYDYEYEYTPSEYEYADNAGNKTDSLFRNREDAYYHSYNDYETDEGKEKNETLNFYHYH